MRVQAALWLRTTAPLAFWLTGCGLDGDPLPAASHFAVLSATSTSRAHWAFASFRRNAGSNCLLTRTADGCVVASCDSAEPSGELASGGTVTVQGDVTVVLDADNDWTSAGEGALFSNGQEVLFDVAAGGDVPAFRSSLRAPSSTSLTAPLPAVEGAPLELTGEDLIVEWVPGNNGLMKFYASAGLAAVSCEWTISAGRSRISAATLAELPSSDGSDSALDFWTEQNAVGRAEDWEFLLLLSGEAAGSTFGGFLKE